MSSFQIKPQNGLSSNFNTTGVVYNQTTLELKDYIDKMSDYELLTLIQLGMKASSKGTYSSNSSYSTTTGGGW